MKKNAQTKTKYWSVYLNLSALRTGKIKFCRNVQVLLINAQSAAEYYIKSTENCTEVL